MRQHQLCAPLHTELHIGASARRHEQQCVRSHPLFVVAVHFRCLVDVSTNNRSRNIIRRTRFFDLRTKGVDSLIQTFFSPTGGGELVTEVSYNFLEVCYFFF